MSYAASKAATDHVVGMLAAKVGRFGIRVNGINPGCMTPPPLLSLLTSPFIDRPCISLVSCLPLSWLYSVVSVYV